MEKDPVFDPIFKAIEGLKKLWQERIDLIEKQKVESKDEILKACLQCSINTLKRCIDDLGV